MSAMPSMEAALEAVVERAVARALAKHFDSEHQTQVQDARALSLVAAAKLARCRKAVLQHAAESGACRAQRRGSRWTLLAGDVAAWVKAGRPVKPQGTR